MSDQNPISLDAQIIARVRQFLQSSNVNQRQLAAAFGADSANFNSWLSGTKGLSVTKMAKLIQILGLDQMQLQAKFSGPSVTARIKHFQSLSGKPITLDNSGGSWIPGQSGQDPNDGSTNDEQALLDEISDLHRQIIDKIKAYQDTYPQ
jgi:transcriptional regulator with XRE-family HTH domain